MPPVISTSSSSACAESESDKLMLSLESESSSSLSESSESGYPAGCNSSISSSPSPLVEEEKTEEESLLAKDWCQSVSKKSDQYSLELSDDALDKSVLIEVLTEESSELVPDAIAQLQTLGIECKNRSVKVDVDIQCAESTTVWGYDISNSGRVPRAMIYTSGINTSRCCRRRWAQKVHVKSHKNMYMRTGALEPMKQPGLAPPKMVYCSFRVMQVLSGNSAYNTTKTRARGSAAHLRKASSPQQRSGTSDTGICRKP
ncbi:hypothetical protein C8R43DRAFT_955246 [Mycena crocata]|nr:hypothetical protein C8R43DRAFT_955246 [Mycena crocata]